VIVPARTHDERATLVAYMASKLGSTPLEIVGNVPFEIVAVKRDDRPMGAIMYYNFRHNVIEMSWAGEPGWLTRGTIRDIFAYPFQQLGCRTVLGTVRRDNHKSRELAQRLGFKEVGVIEEAFGEGVDGVLYSMHRGRCAMFKVYGVTLQ
jgi:RimJ/RimL family protein N-acetyltransferase